MLWQDTDASDHVRKVSISRQYSSPHPPDPANAYQDSPSPFVNTGAAVPMPVLNHRLTTSRREQAQETQQDIAPLPIPQRQGSAGKRNRNVAVQEYELPNSSAALSHAMSAKSSSMGQAYQQTPAALPSSSLQSSSLYSSPSGISFDTSTNPTSACMSRVDSLGGSSFQKGFDMLRVDSANSAANPAANQQGTSPRTARQSFNFMPSQDMSAQPRDPAYDISQTGAQFSTQVAIAGAPNMQKQISGSRQLHPKAIVGPMMPRTPTSPKELDVIRVPSSDGSFKEAIKISPASSYVRPTSDKVMCTHPGCTAQPNGFKGEHEMQRHYDREHKEVRNVYVCAPLAENPDFLSRCKYCTSQKTYNEDYNAGEHLRRMHFNPKKAKTRRGNVKPEEKRGGKGGGHEPRMGVLRNYMVTYQVDLDGNRISDLQKVNPLSSVIVPSIPIGSELFTENVQTFAISPSSPTVEKLQSLSTDNGCPTISLSSTQPAATELSAGNASSDCEDSQPRIAGVSSGVEAHFPFDPISPSIDLNNDPVFFDASFLDTPASFNNELTDFLSTFSS